jgi:hypothetical protein
MYTVFLCGHLGRPYHARPESAALQDSGVQPLNGCHEASEGADPSRTGEQVPAVVVIMSPSLRVFASNLQNHTVQWADECSEAGHSAFGFGEYLYRAADVFGALRSPCQRTTSTSPTSTSPKPRQFQCHPRSPSLDHLVEVFL